MEESEGDGDNTVDDNEMVPDLKYWINVKKRKDNIYTTGKWIEGGLERQNELLNIV